MFRAALISLLLLGCAGSGGGGGGGSAGAAPIAGPSTTYTLLGAIAYSDNTATTLFKSAYFPVGLETLSLVGNAYTLTRYGATCTSIETGTLTFDANNFAYTVAGRNVTNAPHANCTVAYNLVSGQTGFYSNVNWSVTYGEGGRADLTANGIYGTNGNFIYLITGLTTVAGKFVYMTYQKQ